MPSPEEVNDPTRLSSSQDIDSVAAEQKIVDETTVNKVNESEIHIAKCFKCGEKPLNLCKHCGNDFCQNHRSKYSDQYCYLCIAPDNLGLDYLPLEEEDIDESGQTVVRRGRRIKLIGEGWPNTMQMISNFPDTDEGNEGLRIFIAERQRLLKEAMETTEYHRITLSYAEFTEGHRRHSKSLKLQRRYNELKQGVLRVGGKLHRVASAKKTESEDEKLAKLLGLTIAEAQALRKVMNKI